MSEITLEKLILEERERKAALRKERELNKKKKAAKAIKQKKVIKKKTSEDITSLTDAEILKIQKMLRGKYTTWCENIKYDVEEFINDVFMTALSRKTYERSESSPSTYFHWIARSLYYHMRIKFNEKDVRKGSMTADDAADIYSSIGIGSDDINNMEILSYLILEKGDNAEAWIEKSPEEAYIEGLEAAELKEKAAKVAAFTFNISLEDAKMILGGVNPVSIITGKKYGNKAAFIRRKIASANI